MQFVIALLFAKGHRGKSGVSHPGSIDLPEFLQEVSGQSNNFTTNLQCHQYITLLS